MLGNRAIYHDGWIAATTPPSPPWAKEAGPRPDVVNGYRWELYHVAKDYSEADDLAAKRPDKLRELQQLFLAEAKQHDVLPLDNTVLPRVLATKPGYLVGRDEFVYPGPIAGIPTPIAPSILGRSFTIHADVDVPRGGATGMIVTDGGRFGGYGMYVLRGNPVFIYNYLAIDTYRWEGRDALSPGHHTITFDFTYDGPGLGKGGTGVLSVDGREIARRQIPHTIPFILTIDETLDIGSDTRTSVADQDYQVPFPFTGTISRVAFKLGVRTEMAR
jgi:arylsulfatase